MKVTIVLLNLLAGKTIVQVVDAKETPKLLILKYYAKGLYRERFSKSVLDKLNVTCSNVFLVTTKEPKEAIQIWNLLLKKECQRRKKIFKDTLAHLKSGMIED